MHFIPRRPLWSVNMAILVFLAILVLATLSIAYQNGPPDFAGHTSEEIEFTYTSHNNTCTNNPSTTCTATCPSGSFLLAGLCGSITPSQNDWLWFGNPISQTSFSCVDLLHVPGNIFTARATCIQEVLLPP